MTEEGKGPRPVTPPVLAQVTVHPATNQIMVFLNDGIPKEEQATFCLGCAQTFIGLAANMMEKKPESQIIVPQLHMKGSLT